MVTRRDLISGGIVAGLAGGGAPAHGADTPPQEVDLRPIADGLRDVRDELRQQQAALAVSRELISQIRRAQKLHYRAHGRFPVWIDVGTDVFESVYDWHVRNLQPLTVGREPNSRYTIVFFFSTIVLRPDVEPNYISVPYDER